MAINIKVSMKFNAGNVGNAYNVFCCEFNAVGSPTDASVLSLMEDWMESIYNPIKGFMSEAYVANGARVSEIDETGAVVRVIGTISPAISGTAVNDPNSGPTSMSGFARTNVPKVRGSKRFPGVTDTNVVGQLLTNAAVSALADAVAAWIGMPGLPLFYRAGVISSKALGFAPFSGTGAVTNVPGTQVTRKPFRGA